MQTGRLFTGLGNYYPAVKVGQSHEISQWFALYVLCDICNSDNNAHKIMSRLSIGNRYYPDKYRDNSKRARFGAKYNFRSVDSDGV